MKLPIRIAAAALLAAFTAVAAAQSTVKVTPLGGIDGEFCPQDRALVFEDPNGTRILYDPGRTVAGANDPRLGKIDIILVSHMHGDHVGNAHNKAPELGHLRAARHVGLGDAEHQRRRTSRSRRSRRSSPAARCRRSSPPS